MSKTGDATFDGKLEFIDNYAVSLACGHIARCNIHKHRLRSYPNTGVLNCSEASGMLAAQTKAKRK